MLKFRVVFYALTIAFAALVGYGLNNIDASQLSTITPDLTTLN